MSGAAEAIHYWNRRESREEIEEVYGDALVRWIYGTKPGQQLAERFLWRAVLSQAYGIYQSSQWSRHKIQPFIEKFRIPMEEYQEGPYLSFNDFFIRKFKSGKRPFVKTPNEMPAFAEARYYAYDQVSPEQKFPLKGEALSARAILGSAGKPSLFKGGRCYSRDSVR